MRPDNAAAAAALSDLTISSAILIWYTFGSSISRVVGRCRHADCTNQLKNQSTPEIAIISSEGPLSPRWYKNPFLDGPAASEDRICLTD
jgi:hypothetical protein